MRKKSIDKESMICLTPELNQKNSEIIRVSLWPTSSPDRNPLDYAIWSVLESKTNATFHWNIGLLITVIEEEWNKRSEEFTLKVCKSFWRCLDRIIEKTMTAILSKFTVLCRSSYFLKLILFYNRVVFYYTRIFLISLPHPVHRLISERTLQAHLVHSISLQSAFV